MGLTLDTKITKQKDGLQQNLFEPEQTYNYMVRVGVGETRVDVLIPKAGSDTGTSRRLARFGPGLHHLGYGCRDVEAAAKELDERGLERPGLLSGGGGASRFHLSLETTRSK